MKYAVYEKKLDHCSIIIPKDVLALYKRFDFIYNAIKQYNPKSILDIGCGTGEHLTKYIAQAFPDKSIMAVDDDIDTINNIKNDFRNLIYYTKVPDKEKYDLIIASEVIEHINNPVEFLDFLHTKLVDDGILILTLPNGYSLFEFMKIIELIYAKSGLRFLILNIKKLFKKKNEYVNVKTKDTEAVSPHVNFFSYKHITTLLMARGFDIIKYKGRMFLFGFIINSIINLNKYFVDLNTYLGGKLSPFLVSDWMFILSKNKKTVKDVKYKRNCYSRFKIWINYKLNNLKHEKL